MMIAWTLCMILLVLHIGFGIAEIVFWKPLGRSIARNRPDCGLGEADLPRAVDWAGFLAFNQGVYNLIIAVGFYFCLKPDYTVHEPFAEYFALFAIVAGIAGALTGIRVTLIVQTLPGVLLLAAVNLL